MESTSPLYNIGIDRRWRQAQRQKGTLAQLVRLIHVIQHDEHGTIHPQAQQWDAQSRMQQHQSREKDGAPLHSFFIIASSSSTWALILLNWKGQLTT